LRQTGSKEKECMENVCVSNVQVHSMYTVCMRDRDKPRRSVETRKADEAEKSKPNFRDKQTDS
jgi:hypothetical protein